MIIMDPPRRCTFRSYTRTAHCASTLFGPAGTEELLRFGRKIGLREEWLQHRGTPKEHFDLFDGRIDAAYKAGALLFSPKEFVSRTLRDKRDLRETG